VTGSRSFCISHVKQPSTEPTQRVDPIYISCWMLGPELMKSLAPAGPDFPERKERPAPSLCSVSSNSAHPPQNVQICQVAQLLFMLGQTPRDALHGADEPKKRKARQDSIQAAPTPRPLSMGDDKKVMVLPTLFLLLTLALPCLLACHL
jgi:hypothetical protein